jgi:6-phosphogluconolactonase (cycloisomerase 2 family)
VTCTSGSGVTIGGTVSGLTGTGLVLQDNGGDNLSVTQNGSFTFKTAVASGKPYAVTVLTQPTGQTCTVANGTGTAGSSNVTNVTVSCSGKTASVGKFAYVANYTSQTVSAYAIDAASGKLTAAGTPQTAGNGGADGPAAVSLAPNGKFAFSASDDGLHIYAFTINQTTGALTPVAGSPFNTGFTTGMAFPDIAVDAASAHLYVASSGDGKVAGFAIDQTTGALTALSGSPYPAGTGANAIPAFSPDGKFLYVMDTNAVSGFTIASDGHLVPMASTFPTGADPTWIAFTPDGKFAYVSNHGEDTISQYSVNTTTGALTALSTPTAATDAHPWDLTIDASGTHLYAPVSVGSGNGAIDVYTIGANGLLTPVQMTATAPPVGINPMFLAIDPTAQFAYVASAGGGEVYGFSINSSTGALTKLAKSPYSTGANSLPQFITIDPSGKYAYTANENADDISEFQISSTGDLVPVPGSPTIATGAKPIFVSISPEAPGIRD